MPYSLITKVGLYDLLFGTYTKEGNDSSYSEGADKVNGNKIRYTENFIFKK